jgi:hypothetical protein
MGPEREPAATQDRLSVANPGERSGVADAKDRGGAVPNVRCDVKIYASVDRTGYPGDSYDSEAEELL